MTPLVAVFYSGILNMQTLLKEVKTFFCSVSILDLLNQYLNCQPRLLQLPGYFHSLITSKSYWFSLRMTLRRLENWGTLACESFTEQKLNSSLCRRGMDELSSRGTQSHKVESGSFTHIATGMREGYGGDGGR